MNVPIDPGNIDRIAHRLRIRGTWIQGREYFWDGNNGRPMYCLLGAIYAGQEGPDSHLEHEATNLFASLIERDYGDDNPAYTVTTHTRNGVELDPQIEAQRLIVRWNDAPERTWEQVEALIQEAKKEAGCE